MLGGRWEKVNGVDLLSLSLPRPGQALSDLWMLLLSSQGLWRLQTPGSFADSLLICKEAQG